MVDQLVAPMFVNDLGPSLQILVVAGEPMEVTDHHRMRHRQTHALLPPAGGQAMMHGRQICPLRASRGASPWGQAKSVHTKLVHSGGTFCVFLGSDFLDRCGDRRFIVEA
jgi:hypothetical protein